LRRVAHAALGLIILQIGIGAAAVLNGVPPLFQALHVAGATAVWTAIVSVAALSARAQRLQAVPPAPPQPSDQALARPSKERRSLARAYFQLTKPRVMVLLLITTLASMMVAAGGMPALPLVFFTLLGGGLASGGASAINHYLDRDIDG